MIRRPPRSTRTDTLFPYTTLFRSIMTANAEKIAAGLTPFQQAMLLGDYEPEEATGADASARIAAGCWRYDREKTNGRESGRERGCQYGEISGVAVALKKIKEYIKYDRHRAYKEK